MSQRLCRLDDLDDPGSAGFAVEREGARLPVMVIRRGGEVFAYVNSCPHIGAPLDWRPGQFLDVARKNILCANHGAVFTIEEGVCTSGPCAGDKLTRFPVAVRHGWVVVVE